MEFQTMQNTFATIMYSLIALVVVSVLVYISYCKIKYGRFFPDELENDSLLGLGDEKW